MRQTCACRKTFSSCIFRSSAAMPLPLSFLCVMMPRHHVKKHRTRERVRERGAGGDDAMCWMGVQVLCLSDKLP